mgnify:CR=1 FL=1
MSIPLYRISQISSVWNALASDNRKYITRIYKERFFIMNWIKKQRKHLRLWVQVLFTALTNGYVIGFTEGKIYRGTSKKLCVPGLNCYSCPGAIGSCPIGSLQAVLGSKNYKFSFYVIGFLMIFGSLMGRFVCGWLCPFGLVQDLLHKIHFVKRSKSPIWPLSALFKICHPCCVRHCHAFASCRGKRLWKSMVLQADLSVRHTARRYSACCKKIRDFSVPSAFYLGGRSASLSFFLFYLQWYTAHSASIYVHLVRFMVFSTGFHSTITRLMLPNVRNADFAQRNVIWVSRFMKIQTVRNVSAVENAKMSVQPALSIQEYVPKPEFN